MKRLIAVAALAATVSSTSLWAQTDMSMGEALSMLEISVKRDLKAVGLPEVDPMLLTLNQLAGIETIYSDESYNTVDKKSAIMAIVDK